MTKEKTGTQLNQAYTSVDDFNTIKYVLPLLRDEKTRNRLIEEHRACPVGRAAHKGQPMVEHSKDLIRVLDKLRRQPMPGKLLTVCKKPHEDYRIGIASGVRGKPVKILEESFSSEEACEHAIF
ncbi:MAG: inner-membrane translocator, partial [Candidatus Pelagibacterales bacterium]